MNITEIRVKLVNDKTERLRAFCSVTLDGEFVIRDLKVIEGTSGPFVAMPSRKLADRCRKCGCKNHLRARHCNECGARLNENRAPRDPAGRAKLHADVAHPINAACREQLQDAVTEAYRSEMEEAKRPGYQPSLLDHDDDQDDQEATTASDYDELIAELKGPAPASQTGRRGDMRMAGTGRERGDTGDTPEKKEESNGESDSVAVKASPLDSSAAAPQEPRPTDTLGDDGFGTGIL
ncbi:MAG: SpoVG family protein [Phycisphaerae bacterium]|nr:SpoVG family protein [Phycisphaerae bacterium]